MAKAGFWRRFAAVFIDGVIIGGLGYASGRNAAGFVLTVVYETILISQWNGQTVGKKLLGIRVTTVDGGRIDWVKALIRSVSKILSTIPLCLGYFWMLWDPNSQTWHDKIAATVVARADGVAG